MKKILIVGAKGQVGSAFSALPTQTYQWHCLSKEDLDVTNEEAVKKRVENILPSAVINASAYTQVDRAEENPEAALAVNATAVKYLAEACAQNNIPFIHFSTDYVFSGNKSELYQPEDCVDPINVYGKTKALGEAFARMWLRTVIVRVSGVFNNTGPNFVNAIKQRVENKQSLRVVNDQWVSPTPALSIAEMITQLLPRILQEKDFPFGTYHFCGTPAVTWYDFARAIVDVMGHPDMPIEAIGSEEWVSLAKRPLCAILDCDSSAKRLGFTVPDWKDSL